MGTGLVEGCKVGAAHVLGRLRGLPAGCRRVGTEVVLTGSYDILPGFIGWERRALVHAFEVEFAEVRAIRAWLAASARGYWTCSMPEAGIDAAWSVTPTAQVVRLADAADADGLVRRFPQARRLHRA